MRAQDGFPNGARQKAAIGEQHFWRFVLLRNVPTVGNTQSEVWSENASQTTTCKVRAKGFVERSRSLRGSLYTKTCVAANPDALLSKLVESQRGPTDVPRGIAPGL